MPDALFHVAAFRSAAERRDLEAMLDCFTPDAVMRSPVSASLRLAPDGRIREIVFFIRPLPALAGVAAGLAPALARARGFGPVRVAVMAVFGSALRVAIALADRIGGRLLAS